jgi:hypothetical protein
MALPLLPSCGFLFKQIHIRKSNYPNASQQVLLRALEMTWNPGKTQKTIVAP